MYKVDFLKPQTCKYCGHLDYFGEFRWKAGRQICRRCYKADWEERNGKPYPWKDLDETPYPPEPEAHPE